MDGPLTVLVVDDDARARAALVRALDDCAGLAAVGLDRDQAVRLAAGRAALADAVVLDLPRADAGDLEVLAALVSRAPVLVTSLSGSVGRPSRQAGAVAFLEKDGDGDALVESIAAHVRASIAQNAGLADDEEAGA